MTNDMKLESGDSLEIVTRMAEDGTNDGSIIHIPFRGTAYCIAKAPRYASRETWQHNAQIFVRLFHSSNGEADGSGGYRPASGSAGGGK